MIEAPVVRDAENPLPQRPPSGIELIAPPPRSQQRVLHRILGVIGTTQHAVAVGKQRTAKLGNCGIIEAIGQRPHNQPSWHRLRLNSCPAGSSCSGVPIRRSARRERTQNDVPERDGFRTELVRMRGVVVGPGERIITGPLRPHTGTGRRPGPSILGSTWSTRGR